MPERKQAPESGGDDPEFKRDQAGRFVDGTAGGPGRPKGSLSLVGLLKKHLRENPEQADLIVSNLVEQAAQADFRALGFIKECLERIDGRTVEKQQIEVTGPQKLVELVDDRDEDEGEE